MADIKIELIIVGQIFAALILGAIIGFEREKYRNSAGIRTYSAVAFGAALFTLVGVHSPDPTASGRIVANIVTGIGFLGSGIIFKDGSKGLTQGLTTASSIWATAGIGVAVAYNMYIIAIASTVALYFLLALHHFSWYINLKKNIRHKNDLKLEDDD